MVNDMKTSRFRIRLFIALLVFAIIVAFSVSTADYIRLNQQAIKDSEAQIEQATDTVLYALKTVDKAYTYLDKGTARKMEEYTYELQRKYEENPRVETWDFAALSEAYNTDIYIIDEDNKIIHSNVDEEIGLDFSSCCKTFSSILDERRASGELFIDGIDIDQKSGAVKKFSYMATKDKKYIIELGYSLENEDIFKEFNFLTVAEEVVESFDLVEEMHVLNRGGLPFGIGNREKPSQEHYEAFKEARDESKIVEYETVYGGKPVIHRFVPYISEYDSTESTKVKVVEVVYNKLQVEKVLESYKVMFFVQLIVILLFTIIVSSLLANWLSKPVYLAFHDSLTGLKNRAAFNESMCKSIRESNGDLALMMIDIDNFKLINDYFGHDKGDEFLKTIAQSIRATVGKKYNVYRLGGDEFAVIMPETNEEIAGELADQIVKEVNRTVAKDKKISEFPVSVSVGISFCDEYDSSDDLFKKADLALYLSKEKGKNQCEFYSDDLNGHMPFY